MSAKGWSKLFEECMVFAAKDREDLTNIDVSVEDLVPPKVEKKLMTAEVITELEESCFPKGKVRPSGGEIVLRPEKDKAIIIKDFFVYGLRFLALPFLRYVLESFKV
jgi:hypothetical protein